MYIHENIFPVITIKHLVNKEGEPTMPYKLATSTIYSVSNVHVLFCPCVVRKVPAHVEPKALNMRHRSQNGFHGIFVVIPQHQNGASSTYLCHKRYFLHINVFSIHITSIFKGNHYANISLLYSIRYIISSTNW